MNKYSSEEGSRWSRASLRICGESLKPEEIEAALGIQATHKHLKGEQRGPNKAVWRESAWLLRSPLGKEVDLSEQLRWLLDRLEQKLDVVRTLSESYRIDFFCGFSSGSGQGGFTLDGVTLARIARFGVPLALDLYPPLVANSDEGLEPI